MSMEESKAEEEQVLEIEWSYDSSDCETCGWTTSTGCVVRLNGEMILNEPANAWCQGATYIEEGHILDALCRKLNIRVKGLDESYNTMEMNKDES